MKIEKKYFKHYENAAGVSKTFHNAYPVGVWEAGEFKGWLVRFSRWKENGLWYNYYIGADRRVYKYVSNDQTDNKLKKLIQKQLKGVKNETIK